ncbi:hypothetical protein HDV06_001002 [Boothiomyces sp. JEL0866]|nr:hypothetical protein HDV06_001002 [Boothiomyces sp. JEL0866]
MISKKTKYQQSNDSDTDDQYPPSSVTSNPSSTTSEKYSSLPEKYPVITTPDSKVCVCGVEHLDHTLLKNIFEIPLENTVNDLFGDQGQSIFNSSLIESGALGTLELTFDLIASAWEQLDDGQQRTVSYHVVSKRALFGPAKINIVEKQSLKPIAERGFVFVSEISFPEDPSKVVHHRICMTGLDEDFTEMQATVDVAFSKNTKNKKKTTLKQIGKLLGLHRIIQYYLNQEALKKGEPPGKTRQIGGPRKFNGVDTVKLLKEQKANERTGLYGTLKRNLNAHSDASANSTPNPSPFMGTVRLESPSSSVQSTVRSLDGYLSAKRHKSFDSVPPNTPNISPISSPSISPKSIKTRKPEPPSRKETKRIKAYMFDEPESKYYTPRSMSLDYKPRLSTSPDALVPTLTNYQIPRLMPRCKTPLEYSESAETLVEELPGKYYQKSELKNTVKLDTKQKAYFVFHLFIVVFSIVGFKTFIDVLKSFY